MLTIGSLFSGIGGLELGLERAGLGRVVWQVEKDEFCRRVLAKHWPNADRSITDVGRADARNLASVDIMCGGFPCQDVSAAGKGKGLAGARSGLWFEYERIVGELRPTVVIVENVASGANRWLGTVCDALEAMGYSVCPFALSAFDVGAPHRRKRVFVVATRHDARAAWFASYSHRLRQLQPQRSEQNEWRWFRHGDGWSIQPPPSGMGDGVSRRLDRYRALGNAVVPQCAEVIGRIAIDILRSRA